MSTAAHAKQHQRLTCFLGVGWGVVFVLFVCFFFTIQSNSKEALFETYFFSLIITVTQILSCDLPKPTVAQSNNLPKITKILTTQCIICTSSLAEDILLLNLSSVVVVCWLLITSKQQASVSQGQTCLVHCTSRHTEIEAAAQSCPVTIFWHHVNQFKHWFCTIRHLEG